MENFKERNVQSQSVNVYGKMNPVRDVFASNLFFITLIVAGISLVFTILTTFLAGTDYMSAVATQFGVTIADSTAGPMNILYLMISILAIVVVAIFVAGLYNAHVESTKTDGLYESKGLKIIRIAVICDVAVQTVTIIIGIAAIIICSNAAMEQATSDVAAIYAVTKIVAIVTTVISYLVFLLYFWKALSTIKCMEEVVENGFTQRKVSMLLIVFSFIIAAMSISTIFTADIATMLSGVCSIVLYILIAVCLIKVRSGIRG